MDIKSNKENNEVHLIKEKYKMNSQTKKQKNKNIVIKGSSKGKLKMRAGKWTDEEEKYTKKIIEDFKTGKLSDCAEGRTLRGYLSDKLNCNPMRISKKLAGQRMGKFTYKSNNTAPISAPMTPSSSPEDSSIHDSIPSEYRTVSPISSHNTNNFYESEGSSSLDHKSIGDNSISALSDQKDEVIINTSGVQKWKPISNMDDSPYNKLTKGTTNSGLNTVSPIGHLKMRELPPLHVDTQSSYPYEGAIPVTPSPVNQPTIQIANRYCKYNYSDSHHVHRSNYTSLPLHACASTINLYDMNCTQSKDFNFQDQCDLSSCCDEYFYLDAL